MHAIECSEVWGGIAEADQDLCSVGVTASLFSNASQGGKGGDIYYMSVCSFGRLTRVAMADVCGHGEAVSSVSSWLYESISAYANSTDDNEVLVHLNRLAHERGLKALATASVVSFYVADSMLRFANAGHPPVLMHRAGEREWRKVELQSPSEPGNLPLGVLNDMTYDMEGIPLGSGDKILIYTDGVLEAMDKDGEQFGEERLCKVLNSCDERQPDQVKRDVVSALRTHTGGPLNHDDVTIMVLQVR